MSASAPIVAVAMKSLGTTAGEIDAAGEASALTRPQQRPAGQAVPGPRQPDAGDGIPAGPALPARAKEGP